MPRFLFVLVAACLLLAPDSARAQEGTEPIVATDLLQIRQLGDVSISPDGRYAAYTVRRIVSDGEDADDYRYQTQLWLTPVDGSTPPRQLTYGDASATQPTWHPDGQDLAFVRSVDGTSQVHRLSLLGGEAFAVTDVEHGASSPQFSPDGTQLLFSASLSDEAVTDLTGADPAWPAERPALTRAQVRPEVEADPDGSLDQIRAWLGQNEEDDAPRVMTRLDFQGELDLEPRMTYRHWFVQPAEPGTEATPITTGFYSFGSAAWLPSGDQLVVSGVIDPEQHPDRVQDGDLFVVDPDGSNFRRLLDLEGWQLYDPQVSPDGRYVAFRGQDLGNRGYAQAEIGLYALDGQSPPEWLTLDYDRSVSDMQWSPDGRYLYFVAPADGGFPLHRFEALEGRAPAGADSATFAVTFSPEQVTQRAPIVELLTDSQTGVRSFDVGRATVAYVLTAFTNPYELYTSNLAFNRPQRLTEHNARWLADKKVSRPEAYTLENDGYEIAYWIMKPTFFEEDQRYPLLLEIHGGPSAMWGPGEVSMWHEFQFFASRGYGVVFSNPRGSGGYGNAFRRANYQDWGVGPASDVLAAASAAAAAPWVDPDRQVMTGGSYAGYLTAWILTQDQRFQAAVAQRGVYDLGTFLGEGNAWRLVPTHFGGYPWDDSDTEDGRSVREVLFANSPQTFVDQIETPFLIMHGDLDLRTGVIQSEVLYKSLKILEKPVEYVRYPGEGHELSRSGDPHLRMDRLLRIYEFLARHVE